MKLAEALTQRADVTARLAQLKQRALRNARRPAVTEQPRTAHTSTVYRTSRSTTC